MALIVDPRFPPQLNINDNITNDEIRKVIEAAHSGDEAAEDVVFELFFDQPTLDSEKYLLLSKLRALIEGPTLPKA